MSMIIWGADRVFVIAMGDEPATDDEVEAWLQRCQPLAGGKVRVVVDGGSSSLSPRQRGAIGDMTRTLRLDYRAAVLTDSIVIRGMVTALSWLGASQRAFAPGDLAGAFAYLELTQEEAADVQRELPRMRREALMKRKAS